jgi:hypothetical protein
MRQLLAIVASSAPLVVVPWILSVYLAPQRLRGNCFVLVLWLVWLMLYGPLWLMMMMAIGMAPPTRLNTGSSIGAVGSHFLEALAAWPSILAGFYGLGNDKWARMDD